MSGDRKTRPGSAFSWVPGEADRVALEPIRHGDLWHYFNLLNGLHWIPEEVNLSLDRRDWDERMTPDQRHFVRMQLAFFAQIDQLVLKNLDTNFGEEVDCMEARAVFAAQAAQEWVHVVSYSRQIAAVLDGAEREATLDAVRRMPVVGKMHAWAARWLDRALPVGDRLVAFAFVEGVLFSASFAALQWLRSLSLLPGITAANEFILRDEGAHTDFSCLLVRRYLREPPPWARASAIAQSVVEVLDEFVREALPVRLIGMNAAHMCQYVRFRADSVLAGMGYAAAFHVPNPFGFMDAMALNVVAKANFFERDVTSYQKSGKAALELDVSPVDV